MKFSISVDFEDGIGQLARYHSHNGPMSPNEFWYTLVRLTREILRDWAYRSKGQPSDARLWRPLAFEWERPASPMQAPLVPAIDLVESNFGFGDHRLWPRAAREAWHNGVARETGQPYPIENCDCNARPD